MDTKELLQYVRDVVETVKVPPIEENMSSSFMVEGQWFSLTLRRLREIQSWLRRDGEDHTLNAKVLEWAYLAECDFKLWKARPELAGIIYIL